MTQEPAAKLLRRLPEASLLADTDGIIRAANPAVARLLGAIPEHLERSPLLDLLAEDRRQTGRFLREAAGSGGLVPGLITVEGKDGEPVPCRAEAVCVEPWTPERPALILIRLFPRDEETDRFMLLNQKISELSEEVRRRIQLEQERERLVRSERAARAAAEEASRMKDEFLAVVSHELRTPLNTILIWASLLAGEVPERSGEPDQELDPEMYAHGIDAIRRSAVLLGELIQDLLDVSRAITGRLRLRTVDVDPVRVVTDAVEAVRETAKLKGVRLGREIGSDVGRIRGDPERLRQVVWHLLSNAIKFTPPAGRVTVRLVRRGDWAELVVSDTGAGIVPESLPRIFERFTQHEPSRTRTDRGLGLGLSLVRHVVELHGGRVGAYSEGTGKGATFTVTLPLTRDGREQAAASAGGSEVTAAPAHESASGEAAARRETKPGGRS